MNSALINKGMSGPNLWYYLDIADTQKKIGGVFVNCFIVYESCYILNIIEELENANTILNNTKRKPNSVTNLEYDQAQNVCQQAMLNWLSDSIKILLVIENYMKGILSLNCFLIHEVKNNENTKTLSKKQKKSPIHFNELEELHPFVLDEENTTLYNTNLSNKTLSISTMLRAEYNKYIGLDKDVVIFVHELIRYRNSLHFFEKIEIDISSDLISKLRIIHQFIDENIVNKIEQK